MEPPPGDTFIQGTSPFEGHKIWSQKNAVHIIYGDSFARKKKTLSKSVHKSKLAQVTMTTAFTT